MRFISNGDYIFPFQFKAYWAEHVYMWSYQHGAANPDGVMRLPGRLLDLLVFAIFGNIGIAYFYATSCLLVAFLAFFWFSKTFLGVRRLGVLVLGALFFALNPIFLGNLSKAGLLLAVAMLPVAMTALKQGFKERRFSYFLLYVLAMNISLLHPFTFSVNLLATGIYLIYLSRAHAVFIRDNIFKFGLVAIAALLLNAYLILPLASLGTVDKGALSDTVTSAPVDYTSLVDIANTGDIFTGLSLSKGVLKDYEFYSSQTWPFYFLGVFTFYAILFGVYVKVEKRAKPNERRRFVLSVAVFLLLLALSTATFLRADVLIKFMIGLPGGWMFRSPLKWQLYMPLALMAALVIALKYVRPGKGLKLLYVSLSATFVLMNAYLFVQIYQRLLTPRSLNYFGALASASLEHKNLLFVNSNACMAFARDNPGVATELNQVFISKDVQVKHVEAGSMDTVSASQYDYVLGCQTTLDSNVLTKRYAFKKTASFASNTYALYQNTRPLEYVSAQRQAYAIDQPVSLSGKYAFTHGTLGTPFNFTLAADAHPATGLQDVFDTLSPASIHGSALTTELKPLVPGEQQLYLTHVEPLFYTAQGNNIAISATPLRDGKPVGSEPLNLTVPQNGNIKFSYADPAYSYKNAVENPSLEQGLWEAKVGDCNAYDAEPDIAMNLDKTKHTQGNQSLELIAKKHIACTGPKDINVKEGEHYLLHLDYASKGGRYAGYFVGFDDLNMTSTGQRMDSHSGDWTSYTTEIVVPPGAEHLHLLLYAYPDTAPGKQGQANYDNVSATRIPNVKNHFFVVSKPPTNQNDPAPQTQFSVLNPTKTLVTAHTTAQPFYLATKESYNHLWQLSADTGAHGIGGLFAAHGATVSGQDHLQMNGGMNGWYVDPQALCKQTPGACVANADGSYDLHLIMDFTPQRWFYMGSIVSIAAAAGTIAYVAYDIRRHRQKAKR